jgi:hypothetical protein
VTTTDRYSEWDAAYLLGSLTPAERREFELHLEGCESCSAAVAELAGMPGLLSKAPADEAAQLLAGPDAASVVPDTLLPRLVRAVRRRRVRMRAITSVGTALGVAAAAALAVVLVFPQAFPGPARPAAETIALSQVVQSPLRASIRLISQPWGTRVEMDCRYAKALDGQGYGTDAPGDYAMWVRDAAGNATQIATWTASSGQDAEPAGTTSLTVRQIASVEVRQLGSDEVLLRGRP